MKSKWSFLKVLGVFTLFETGAAFTAPIWSHFLTVSGENIRLPSSS